jgi:hypothetical protein
MGKTACPTVLQEIHRERIFPKETESIGNTSDMTWYSTWKVCFPSFLFCREHFCFPMNLGTSPRDYSFPFDTQTFPREPIKL